ncbi:VINC protein, partial [Lophotis ruficrista]|nr:VINC protein [Lophotis ruficrista]
IRAASRLSERLSALRDAGDVPGVLAAFRAFSEALLLLSGLTAKHLQELRDRPRKKSLAQTLRLLHKCVPLLHAAKRRHLKRSRDRRVSPSEEYAFQLTERIIEELASLLLDHTDSREPRDGDGTFSRHVSRLLALLSGPDPARLSDSEFSARVDAVVFHCVLLAGSSRPDLKAELVKGCWDLLRLRKSICGHLSQREGWAESSLQKERRTMREELEKLDRAALAATLCQILHAFLEGKESLRRLVEDALSLAGTGCFPAGQGGFLKKLQPLTASFFTQAQQMLRAADFVLARCTKTQTAGEIVEEVEYLKRLLASLPPLLAEMGRNTAPSSAAEQLRSLARAWAGTTENLLRCLEETVGTREVLQLSIREMAKHGERCEKALGGQDPARLSWHAAQLSRWARWAVEAATRYVDRATDPIFRNGLLVWVEQLAGSVRELEAVAALCPERLSRPQTRDVFSKAASCLLDAARRVRDGLDGSNHPDILSPLRERVRGADVATALELSRSRAGPETVTGDAALQDDVSSRLSPGNVHPDVVPRTGEPHPVIAALLAATSTHDTAAVGAACSALLELSEGCIDAAKEALPVAEAPQAETLGQYQEIAFLTARLISLARETAPGQRPPPGKLLHAALALSERICQTKECLAAAAGSWYRLSRQVFGFLLSADFLSGKQALEETATGLAGAVRFAGDIASTACATGNPASPDVRESFLQVQAKFSRAQTVTKALLETAASFQGSCGVGKASLELRCVQWAVSTRVLLCAVDRFIGRDLLFLRELRDAVRNKLCPRSLLAAASENSLRLQEAARLSYLSCPEDHGGSEILALREEVKVLMEALLEASDILSVSPLPAASLYVRFELLQRDLALRAKALLLHLEKVNSEYLRVIREVVGPALSPLPQEERERSKQAFEEKASRLTANVQWVKATLQDVLKASTQLQAQENLLSVADHLLVLTSEAVGSASQLFQSRREEGRLHLASVVWYWSAQAHHLVTQLRAVRGVGRHVLQLISQRLRNVGERRSPEQRRSTAKLFPARELDAPSRATPAETRPSGSGRGSGAAGEAPEAVQ